MNMSKLFIVIAAFNGFVAVSFGAFGAHALKARLSEASLVTWQTAVHYQFYHLLALLFVGMYLGKYASGLMLGAAYLLIAGILLFCGSLYLLALGGPRWLGPITPLGGLSFILAWLLIIAAVAKQ